jgi:hypothetical protein
MLTSKEKLIWIKNLHSEMAEEGFMHLTGFFREVVSPYYNRISIMIPNSSHHLHLNIENQNMISIGIDHTQIICFDVMNGDKCDLIKYQVLIDFIYNEIKLANDALENKKKELVSMAIKNINESYK